MRDFPTHHSLPVTHYRLFLWLIALAAYILAGTPITPFHGDESTQIFMSRDYAYQFLQRELSRLAYADPPQRDQEQHLRLLNGTVNKYLIGLAWHVGGFRLNDLNQQWDWGADWEYNGQNGHLPGADLLRAARWPSALLLAAGVVVMFALGWIVGGSAVASLASLYYALCPPLLLNGHRAMMEGSLTFFSLFTVLVGVWFAKRPTWIAAVVFGAAAGLALASKHSAIFTVGAVYAACLIVNHKDTKITEEKRKCFVPSVPLWLKLLFSAAVLLFTFYALNPAWWGDPLARARTVLGLRQELLTIQTDAFGAYASPLDALAGFARQVLIALPQYYELPGWESYIADEIARYESSPWRGVSVGGSWWGAALLLAMLVTGGWALLRDTRISRPVRWVVGLWALVVILSTLILTPLEWQRYYVPVYPAVGLLAALGIKSTIEPLRRRGR